jgi:hypothetical protein
MRRQSMPPASTARVANSAVPSSVRAFGFKRFALEEGLPTTDVGNRKQLAKHHSEEPQHEIYLFQFAFVSRFVALRQCGDRAAIDQTSNTGSAAFGGLGCLEASLKRRNATGSSGDPESDRNAFGGVVAQREVGTRRFDAEWLG